MSLTVARSERVRSVLTHASCTRTKPISLSSARVSNALLTFDEFTLKVNKNHVMLGYTPPNVFREK